MERLDTNPKLGRLVAQSRVPYDLAAHSEEGLTLRDGFKLKGVPWDADGHQSPEGDPRVTFRAEGGEQGLTVAVADLGGRGLKVCAGGAHACRQGAGLSRFDRRACRQAGDPGQAELGAANTLVRSGVQVHVGRCRSGSTCR